MLAVSLGSVSCCEDAVLFVWLGLGPETASHLCFKCRVLSAQTRLEKCPGVAFKISTGVTLTNVGTPSEHHHPLQLLTDILWKCTDLNLSMISRNMKC